MPSYSLIIFGSSAVYSIGRDLSILKDYPEEQVKLIKEIEEANQYFKNNTKYKNL
jgi:dolichyl-phosphate mannosyltransferase polypeptide 3